MNADKQPNEISPFEIIGLLFTPAANLKPTDIDRLISRLIGSYRNPDVQADVMADIGRYTSGRCNLTLIGD